MQELTMKTPQAHTAAQTLSEPAQSQCTWASHKSHVARESGQPRYPHFARAWAVEMRTDISMCAKAALCKIFSV